MDEIYEGPDNVKLIIDVGDPDTPAIVGLAGATATWDCAVNTGELTGFRESVFLGPVQIAWLQTFRMEVDEAYNTARAGMKEYE